MVKERAISTIKKVGGTTRLVATMEATIAQPTPRGGVTEPDPSRVVPLSAGSFFSRIPPRSSLYVSLIACTTECHTEQPLFTSLTT